METFKTNSLNKTYELGAELAKRFGAGDCVALIGPLGAGKTALVRGIASGLGLDDERLVSSPTFVLVRQYAGRVAIYHVDLYRLGAPAAELADLGIDEMLENGVVLIEWADRAAGRLPRPRWQIDISPVSARVRRFDLRRIG